MNYVKEYLDAINSGDEVVSIKIKTLYQREVEWMNNPPVDFPFYFDEATGARPIEFIETFCKNSKGKMARQTIKLELFQKAKLQLVFGWLEKDTDKHRIKEVVDFRARKCGKSTETAGVEWEPPETNRGRKRNDGPGRQPAHEAVRPNAKNDKDPRQRGRNETGNAGNAIPRGLLGNWHSTDERRRQLHGSSHKVAAHR